MQLTRHRDEYTLTMSLGELIFLVENLGSDPLSVADQERVTEWLHELTYFHTNPEVYKEYTASQIY